MVIEESVIIDAPMDRVWDTFTDLTCWTDWCSVITDVSVKGKDELTPGGSFNFCIRPFVFPVRMEPVIEEVVPGRRLVWTGSKFGVTARHEYNIEQADTGVKLTSREEFTGNRVMLAAFRAARWRLAGLTKKMLKEFKGAAQQ